MNDHESAPVHPQQARPEAWILTEHFSHAPSDVTVFASRDDLCDHITERVLDGHDYKQWLTTGTEGNGLPSQPQVSDFSREQRSTLTDRFLSFWEPEIVASSAGIHSVRRFAGVSLHPAPAAHDCDEPDVPYSDKVAECQLFAHQSRYGVDVLNVEIDAPAGVTVRIHINDGRVYEGEIAQ